MLSPFLNNDLLNILNVKISQKDQKAEFTIHSISEWKRVRDCSKTQILEPSHILAVKAQDPEFGPQEKNVKKTDVAVCLYHHSLAKVETGESLGLTDQAAHTAGWVPGNETSYLKTN